jgi:hypothetical protein
MLSALTATTAKKQITEYRNQVVPAQGIATLHAMASLLCQRLPLREAIDADIQEAAYHNPEEEKPNSYYDVFCFNRCDHRG